MLREAFDLIHDSDCLLGVWRWVFVVRQIDVNGLVSLIFEEKEVPRALNIEPTLFLP